VCTLVKPEYWELKEVSLFLLAANSLPADAALGLYVKAGPSEWLYRGCVHNGHPSEVMPLQWPAQDGGYMVPPQPGWIQVGISIEPLQDTLTKEGSRLGEKIIFAERIGLNLFRFLESFATQAAGDAIVIPADALDRWMKRFQEKFKRDPDFLTRDAEKF